jgi:hypothetical protein
MYIHVGKGLPTYCLTRVVGRQPFAAKDKQSNQSTLKMLYLGKCLVTIEPLPDLQYYIIETKKMSTYIRGHELFQHDTGNHQTPLWQAIENAVRDKVGKKPFDATEPKSYEAFEYLQSQSRTERFKLVEGHSRYRSESNTIKAIQVMDGLVLGPVETDILSFAHSPNPQLGQLVGWGGSGKSTTLNYLMAHCLARLPVILCDFDACLDVGNNNMENLTDNDIERVLARTLSRHLNRLISPKEEWGKLWTWGLSQGVGRNHPTKDILSAAADKLRIYFDDNWLSESDDAIRIRKQCHAELLKNNSHNLIYQALRIDYYLTCLCKDDRSRFLLIIDNVDPLPPRVQYKIQRLASRLQTAAYCKVLLSTRPLTYSSTHQSGHRVVEIIEHIGPSVIDLIENRVKNCILNIDMPKLAVRIREDGYGERIIHQEQAKGWVWEVLRTLKQDRRSSVPPPGEPNARIFVEGVCGYSLRSALVLGPEIFGSAVIPILGTLDGELSRSHRLRVRDHDIIRAMLEGSQGYFKAHAGRITDNVFDLGEGAASRSCTSKVRLLKKLAGSNNGIVMLGELRTHLLHFGYNDQLILDTVNSVIAQTKRLAWSDKFVQYATLDGCENTKIHISEAGRFYINYAIFNLEYVQGVHVDVLLPQQETLKHDPRHFVDRARSLEFFVRYLNQQDHEEVLNMLDNKGASDYNTVCNGSLFSIDIITALARQIENVGKSLQAGKLTHERHLEIQYAIDRWTELADTVKNAESELLIKLRE